MVVEFNESTLAQEVLTCGRRACDLRRVTVSQVAVAMWVQREGVGMLWTNYDEVSPLRLITRSI